MRFTSIIVLLLFLSSFQVMAQEDQALEPEEMTLLLKDKENTDLSSSDLEEQSRMPTAEEPEKTSNEEDSD